MEALILDRATRTRLECPAQTTYQRLLIHRAAAYYRLSPEADSVTKLLAVSVTQESRVPLKRLADLVPSLMAAPEGPMFKIMRRDTTPRALSAHSSRSNLTLDGSGPASTSTSAAGDSDGESASATSASLKKRITYAEREAAYAAARERIFDEF
ncbi:hypothetical protein BKA62DRAFT_594895, partial [Auriculariales sp. MPI-PUGE-AT-0066]